MNTKMINTLFKEASVIIKDIAKSKENIKMLTKEIDNKEKRNKNIFDSSMSILNQKENKIKSLMENKHFTFIKYIDLIDNRDIVKIEGLELNSDLGFISSEILNRITYDSLNKSLEQSGKKIHFAFDESNYSNELNFSFKDLDGLPATPKKIRIEYDEFIDDFFEPNFRFYNRNRADIFNNTFYFYPKKVKKLIFEFEQPINFENSFCNLCACEYDTSSMSEVVLKVTNEKAIKNFNIYKNVDETSIPLIYSISEDNIEYSELDFGGSKEKAISLNSGVDFTIKIKPDYKNAIQKEVMETSSSMISKNALVRSNGVVKLESKGNIKDYKISLTYSSYVALKEKVEALVYPPEVESKDYLKITDLTTCENGVYSLLKNHLIITDAINEREKTMMFFDDFNIIKDDIYYFKFYLNKKTNELYYSEFMDEFNFYIETITESVKEKVNDNLLTPYVFDISVKG